MTHLKFSKMGRGKAHVIPIFLIAPKCKSYRLQIWRACSQEQSGHDLLSFFGKGGLDHGHVTLKVLLVRYVLSRVTSAFTLLI